MDCVVFPRSHTSTRILRVCFKGVETTNYITFHLGFFLCVTMWHPKNHYLTLLPWVFTTIVFITVPFCRSLSCGILRADRKRSWQFGKPGAMSPERDRNLSRFQSLWNRLFHSEPSMFIIFSSLCSLCFSTKIWEWKTKAGSPICAFACAIMWDFVYGICLWPPEECLEYLKKLNMNRMWLKLTGDNSIFSRTIEGFVYN